MHTPFISIIIPVYNVEAYVAECLDSILRWQFADWEAILIDDGSPDNSGAICDEYAQRDARFKVVHKENEGVSVARNVGLDMALGEWCWFVDSDDLIDTRTPVDFELLKDKDLIMFDLKTFLDGDRVPLTTEALSFDECNDLNAFYGRWVSYTHPNIWYHRRFWDIAGKYSIRFSKGIKVGEDIEFMRKCELLAKKPIKVNHTNYYYRLREGSAYHNDSVHLQTIKDALCILPNLHGFIKKYQIIPVEGFIDRFTNLAASIPAHALKAKLWKRPLQNDFKKIVCEFEACGIKLTSSRYVWIATRIPHVLGLAANIESVLNKRKN